MQVTRYTISFFWLLQFGTFIRRHSFFMITIYVIFLPSTLAGFFIAICRVMTNRFRALTSGWMWFIGERCLRSLREPITEIRVSRTFNKLLVLLGHIFPGTEIISVNAEKWTDMPKRSKRNFLLDSLPLFLFSFKAVWKITSTGRWMFFHAAGPVHDFVWSIIKRIQNSRYKWLSWWKAPNVRLAISNQIKFAHTSHIYFIVGISWFTRIVQISIFRTLWWRWVRFIIPYKIHVVITNTEQARNVSKWVVRKTMSWHVTFS